LLGQQAMLHLVKDEEKVFFEQKELNLTINDR